MDTILNILFLVLSVFMALVTVVFIVIAVYVILVIKNLSHLFKVIKEEGEKIVGDIHNLRENAKSNGTKFASMALSVLSFLKQPKKSKKD